MSKTSRLNAAVAEISRKTGVGLVETSKVLNAYIRHLASDIQFPEQPRDPLLFGIMKVDSIIDLMPGITIVYSESDVGKTSFLKTMAMNLEKQGQIVLYIDAECKMYLHQLDMMGDRVLMCAPQEDKHHDAIRYLIDTGLVDVILIDTISSMPFNTQKAFLFSTRKRVPFIIMATQMRIDYKKNKKRPACSDSILSSSHTQIYLTESEKISFERVDMKRVQFSIIKYEADRSKTGIRSSFVISDNMVSNFWSAVDWLHSSGLIRAHGQNKYLDGKLLGKYSDIVDDEVVVSQLLSTAWNNISDKEVDDGIFCEPRISLQWVQAEEHESQQGDPAAGEAELSGSDSSGLSYY